MLYDGGDGAESVKRYLSDDSAELLCTANVKVVLIDPGAQRRGLARTLLELLEPEARSMGKSELLCTIHRANRPSAELFGSLGYRKVGRAATTYGRRDIHARRIVTPGV